MKLKIKDLAFKTTDNYQYAEVLVNGKTGSRPIPLINSIPYVKDYLDHEHPQPSNPNAPLICGIGKSLGRHITAITLSKIYGAYKKQLFPKLLESPNVPPEDKQKIIILFILAEMLATMQEIVCISSAVIFPGFSSFLTTNLVKRFSYKSMPQVMIWVQGTQ
jgi:hypothetical protein